MERVEIALAAFLHSKGIPGLVVARAAKPPSTKTCAPCIEAGMPKPSKQARIRPWGQTLLQPAQQWGIKDGIEVRHILIHEKLACKVNQCKA